jgi:hypothetical protein
MTYDDYQVPGQNNESYSYDDYYIHEGEICEGPSEKEKLVYSDIAWWLEGIGQMILGSIGFIANCVAIPILGSKEMSSMFNRLLTCLAVFDNIFIVCSVLEGVRKHIGSTQTHEYLFGYFLYQFHNMVMCCSAYLTVVLALERYRAVWRPIEYHNNVNSSAHPWRRVLKSYICPVVVFSVLFNLPKFFETKFEERTIHHYEWDETTNNTLQVRTYIHKIAINIIYGIIMYTRASCFLIQLYLLWCKMYRQLLIVSTIT